MNKQTPVIQLIPVRFFAALFAVIFNLGEGVAPFNSHVLHGYFPLSATAVSFIFTLSGFLIFISHSEMQYSFSTHKTFLLKKLSEFYPLYILSLLFVFAYKLIEGTPQYFKALASQILLLQSIDVSSVNYYNMPGWIISAILVFYACFPLLLFFYKKAGIVNIFAFGIAFWMLTQVFGENSYAVMPDFINYSAFTNINQFILGNVTGWIFLTLKDEYRKNYFFEILLLIFSFYFITRINMLTGFKTGFLCIIFCPLILLLAMDKGIILKTLNNSLFVHLDKCSYCIYIMQFPVFWFTYVLLSDAGVHQPELKFYSALAVLILVSVMLNKYFDEPVKKFFNSRIGGTIAKDS